MQPMLDDGRTTASSKFLPVIWYRDPDRAVRWIETTFGFRRHRTKFKPDGSVGFAQLIHGANLLSVRSADSSERLKDRIDRLNGDNDAETEAAYVAVDDIDAHFAKMKEAGAEIVGEIETGDDGDRRYSCRDPEGRVWRIGTRDRWTAKTEAKARSRASFLSGEPLTDIHRAITERPILGIGLMLAASAFSAGLLFAVVRTHELRAERPDPAVVLAKADKLIPTPPADTSADTSHELAEAKSSAARSGAELAAAIANREAEQQKRAAAEQSAAALAGEVERLKAEVAAAEKKVAERAATPEPPVLQPAKTEASVPLALPSNGDSSPLAEGQRRLAKGEIEAARIEFKQAAEEGSPEAALALGSTYDPASLAQFGMADAKASVASARRWYRRAHELASAAQKPADPVVGH